MTPIHAFHPDRPSSMDSPTNNADTSWLSSHLIKRRPPKALVPPISLFSCNWLFGVPNKETNCRAAKPDHCHWHLIWDHRRTAPWCGEGRWSTHGGRWQSCWRVGWWLLMLCVVCFVFCVLCACIINYSIFFYFFANQLGKINLDKVQMGKLCTTVNKKPPRKHPDIIRCASVEWFIQVAHNLTLIRELYCVLWGRKNGARNVLRKARFSKVLHLPFFDDKMCYSGDILHTTRKGTHLDNDSCLPIYKKDHGDVRYSATNPVRTELHFSTLCQGHGDYGIVGRVVVCGGCRALFLFQESRLGGIV